MSLNDLPKHRRRGEALEDALLDAAWQELAERGYDELTIDAVATRAGTSRPVIYRRWPGKPELVRAAIAHNWRSQPVVLPDTGALRSDLIELLTTANEHRIGIAITLGARLGEYFRATGSNLAELREMVVGGGPTGVDILIARAVQRGEIDPAKLTPRIAQLPFDLFRLEVLMTAKPLPAETIEEIVDTIFLPLVLPDR